SDGGGGAVVEVDLVPFDEMLRQDQGDPPTRLETLDQGLDLIAVGGVFQGTRREHQRVDLICLESPQVLELPRGVPVGAGNEQSVAVGTDLVFESLDELAEVGVRYVVDDHADRLRTGSDQGPRQLVGLEAETFGGGQHSLAGLV